MKSSLARLKQEAVFRLKFSTALVAGVKVANIITDRLWGLFSRTWFWTNSEHVIGAIHWRRQLKLLYFRGKLTPYVIVPEKNNEGMLSHLTMQRMWLQEA